MDTTDAREVALTLMSAHGLVEGGWTFTFDRATSRLGLCTHATRTIQLGRAYVESACVAEVEQTMLHEIAHALVGAGRIDRLGRYRAHGHGPVWKRQAALIGYTGRRTATNPAAQARQALLVDQARATEPLVGVDANGPLVVGARVVTRDGWHTGLLVSVSKVNCRFLSDADDQVWSVAVNHVRRANAKNIEVAAGRRAGRLAVASHDELAASVGKSSRRQAQANACPSAVALAARAAICRPQRTPAPFG